MVVWILGKEIISRIIEDIEKRLFIIVAIMDHCTMYDVKSARQN